uniref:Uncharacterized protein n=1 Tax=Anguilla anguilla TaxID=7936 RepID=A0A0E9T5U6_ANGAN
MIKLNFLRSVANHVQEDFIL